MCHLTQPSTADLTLGVAALHVCVRVLGGFRCLCSSFCAEVKLSDWTRGWLDWDGGWLDWNGGWLAGPAAGYTGESGGSRRGVAFGEGVGV